MLAFPPGTAIAAPTTLVVNSTVDRPDVFPGNGVCATSTGACTLRAAVQESNALDDTNIIQVPAGTYELSLVGTGEDAAATGDLDVTAPVSIVGVGAESTIIDAGGGDRVFHIMEEVANVEIPLETPPDVTLRGGGFYVDADADVRVSSSDDRRQQLADRKRCRWRDHLDQFPDRAEPVGDPQEHDRGREPARAEL